MISGRPLPRRSIPPLVSIFLSIAILTAACSSGRFRSNDPEPRSSGFDSAANPQAAKIYLVDPGYYRIRSQDLIDAGLKIQPEQAGQIRLYHRGNFVNYWLDQDGQEFSIGFYGTESDSLYSRESVYWLEIGEAIGAEIRPESEATVPAPTKLDDFSEFRSPEANTVIAQLHLEQNSLYLPQVDTGDHWLWESLPAPNSTDLELIFSNQAPGIARLHLSIWAGTSAPQEPDHHIRLLINDMTIADEYLDGIGWHSIDAEFSTEILANGVNHLTIDAAGDTGVAADIVYLNAVDVVFPRYPVVTEGAIQFIASGEMLRFQGFHEPFSIYDISEPMHVSRVAENLDPDASFTGETGRRYLATGEDGFKKPAGIFLAESTPDLRQPEAGAEYVALGPIRLLEPLDPLIELRSRQGLVPMVVDVQAVYDQFNFGYPEPEAIQKFVRYAMDHWQPAPKFLLLVGDASYDPRGYNSPPQANQLPTFLVQTEFGGETATDVEFVQLNDDPWPDLAIGRMPARTPEQVEDLVAKTLDYESSISSGEMKPTVAAIADGQDPSFRDDAQAFLNLFPSSFQGELYSPDAGVVGANQEIKLMLESGNQLVAYFGHGSVNMWGKDQLFTSDDAGKLAESKRLPVVINMTCLTGLYTHPKVESLTEALLWKRGGGAVAILAPSSLTLPGDQSFLSKALVEAMLTNPHARLGEIHLQARRRVPADASGTLDVMRTFMLFGDPALRMAQ